LQNAAQEALEAKLLMFVQTANANLLFRLSRSRTVNTKPHLGDETSLITISTQQPVPGSDISYSIRHVEESWHHLIKSDDNKKLKEIAVCNFDFLLAAVSSAFWSLCASKV